jgi:hypothetical protein
MTATGHQRVAHARLLAKHTPFDVDDFEFDDLCILTLTGVIEGTCTPAVSCHAIVIGKTIEAEFAMSLEEFEDLWQADDVFGPTPDTIEPWLKAEANIHEPSKSELDHSDVGRTLKRYFFNDDFDFDVEIRFSELALAGNKLANRWSRSGRPVRDTLQWVGHINHLVEHEEITFISHEVAALCMSVRDRRHARTYERHMLASLITRIVEEIENI